MRHLSAYLMCVVGGNATPSAEDVTKVIVACGGAVDEEKLAALMADLEGKSVAELLSAGMEKVKNCSTGAAAAPAAGAAEAAPAAAAAAPKEEEVDPMEGGMSMFGGGDGGDY